jgi:hypothetical protein
MNPKYHNSKISALPEYLTMDQAIQVIYNYGELAKRGKINQPQLTREDKMSNDDLSLVNIVSEVKLPTVTEVQSLKDIEVDYDWLLNRVEKELSSVLVSSKVDNILQDWRSSSIDEEEAYIKLNWFNRIIYRFRLEKIKLKRRFDKIDWFESTSKFFSPYFVVAIAVCGLVFFGVKFSTYYLPVESLSRWIIQVVFALIGAGICYAVVENMVMAKYSRLEKLYKEKLEDSSSRLNRQRIKEIQAAHRLPSKTKVAKTHSKSKNFPKR